MLLFFLIAQIFYTKGTLLQDKGMVIFMKRLPKPAIITISVCLIMIVGILFLLWSTGVIVTDYSVRVGVEGMTWNGRSYSSVPGQYSEGKRIAKSKNGWNLNEVKEDPSHTFVVVRSFLDQSLYVANDYIIPQSGKVTKAYWNRKYIADKDFLEAINEIDTAKTTTFEYETEGIFMLTDYQNMRELYFAYEDCPVATVHKGYMGKVNGKWVITTHISSDRTNADGSPKPYTVSCYEIPQEYTSILEKYMGA